GITGTLDSLDKLSTAVTGNTIAENIDNMKHIIIAAFNVISNGIEYSIPIFKLFGSIVGVVYNSVKTLSPALIAMAAAYAGFVIVGKITKMIEASNRALIIAEATQKVLTLSTK